MPATPDAPKPKPFADLVRTYGTAAAVNYLLATLACLAILLISLNQRGVDLGVILVLVLAVPGVLSQWTAAPPLVVLLVGYFLVFPEGIPDPGYAKPWELASGHFRVADLVLAAAAVGYVAAQYRLLAVTHLAIPDEAKKARPPAPPTRRAAAGVPAGEIGRLAAVVAAAVLAGQFAWLALTRTHVELGSFVPLAFGDRPDGSPFPAPAGRLVLLCGLLFFGTLTGVVAFGYWRWHRLRPDEAQMVLLDTAWNEARRELVRVESRRAAARRGRT